MAVIGYARVSTTDQNPQLQLDALDDAAATRVFTDHGVSVVFSAGNAGPGNGTLNPYSQAPWVVSVGATDQNGVLAAFSGSSPISQSGTKASAPSRLLSAEARHETRQVVGGLGGTVT